MLSLHVCLPTVLSPPKQGTATALRSQLRDVSVGLAGSDLSDGAARERWLVVARRLGESYLRLEKYVNINYAGLQKILKKHDKMLPEAPCAHFYKVSFGLVWVSALT